MAVIPLPIAPFRNQAELATQLDVLFKRSLHKLALDVARADGADLATIANIQQRCGEGRGCMAFRLISHFTRSMVHALLGGETTCTTRASTTQP